MPVGSMYNMCVGMRMDMRIDTCRACATHYLKTLIEAVKQQYRPVYHVLFLYRMCIGMHWQDCGNQCIDICVDMCIHMHTDMCIKTCIGMCADMCIRL